jgi:hypothetical protein
MEDLEVFSREAPILQQHGSGRKVALSDLAHPALVPELQ